MRLTYLAGKFSTVVLRLPVFLSRFMEGVTLEQAPFFERWKIIGGESPSLFTGMQLIIVLRTTSRSAAHLPYQVDFIWRC